MEVKGTLAKSGAFHFARKPGSNSLLIESRRARSVRGKRRHWAGLAGGQREVMRPPHPALSTRVMARAVVAANEDKAGRNEMHSGLDRVVDKPIPSLVVELVYSG